MSKSKSSNSRRRVNNSNANLRLPVSNLRTRVTPLLTIFEDRRTFYPSSVRPAVSFSTRSNRLRLRDRSYASFNRHSNKSQLAGLSQTQAGFAFTAPERVLICVRRKRRKEVLHALRKTGISGQRRPRRSFSSTISCRS